tara:strand:- start:2757 stop:3470 length:714 start_codon:yes stop_codon:yes gene_type:complete
MKTYLVFGATGSIGSSLATQLYNDKQKVHLVGRNDNELVKLSSKLNCKYTILNILENNISDILKDGFNNTNIGGLAYCIGSIDLKPLRIVKKQDIQRCLDINFFPIIEIIKGLQDNLKRNNGSIVLFSTVAVQKGFANHSIIASVKGAIEALTVSLAAEFAPHIRVNCIAPSLTNSKIAEPLLKSKIVAEGIIKAHPLKRIGEGKDSAAMAKFLLTEDSSWITGQIIGIDGGRSTIA